eukprot:TRINITY_DN26273_c0_g7_i1.p1 TRINITY_DN26273_c0_g7~~TRINITY_DN26273_c0_g7_i1.p1  ORF type:complete len:1043 (-),score=80.19 TRINITY_DN26273_c0_g7_i1:49-3114(-)
MDGFSNDRERLRTGRRTSWETCFEIEDDVPVQRERVGLGRLSDTFRPLTRMLPQRDERLDFQRVLSEERQCIGQQARSKGRKTFSIAFSGGGVRASAYQAGVLWRLAEKGLLDDVEYMSAISGGGYVAAAFASHCFEAQAHPWEGLAPESDARAWYLGVVAKMICRMQDNAGNFVRDAISQPGHMHEGDGVLPRIFDLPILLLSLIITLTVNPLFFVCCFAVPFALAVELYFGGAMRAAFCVEKDHRFEMLWEFSGVRFLLRLLIFLVPVTFGNLLMWKCLPCCKFKQGSEGFLKAPTGYRLGQGMNAFLTRFTFVVLVLFVALVILPDLHVLMHSRTGSEHMEAWTDKLRVHYCSKYIKTVTSDSTSKVTSNSDDGFFVGKRASDTYDGKTWYKETLFWKHFHTKVVSGGADQEGATMTPLARSDTMTPLTQGAMMTPMTQVAFDTFSTDESRMTVLVYWIVGAVCFGFGVAICFAPWFGSKPVTSVIKFVGPTFLCIFLLFFTQNLVYGQITPDTMHFFMRTRADGGKTYFWDSFATWSLLMGVFVLPFYEEIRSFMHVYYRRTLQSHFFCRGQDRMFSELRRCSRIPFLILTGVYSDYQHPKVAASGNTLGIGEISFTPLHTGGEEIGYVPMSHITLSKCVALSGAGCLDAIGLSMSESLSMRFWLEVLNLSWGDFVLFQAYRISVFEDLSKGAGNRYSTFVRFLHRVPGGIVLIIVFLLFSFGWSFALRGNVSRCRVCFSVAIYIFLSFVALSFLSLLPGLDFLASSPVIRQIHQVTRHLYVGNVPPRMLYVTDGGAIDCTGLAQLFRRRCSRILFVFAAADPQDDLDVLRTALEYAAKQKLAMFYDPSDPRRHIDDILAKFKADKHTPYFHLGISYCFGLEDGMPCRTGHLIAVKNRLPPSFAGTRVPPLLTESEIRGDVAANAPPPDAKDLEDHTIDMLGGLGCCNCCHRVCNVGGRFPHGNTVAGYLYMSPIFCSCLVRLGYSMSEEAVEAISREGSLADEWESHVRSGNPMSA